MHPASSITAVASAARTDVVPVRWVPHGTLAPSIALDSVNADFCRSLSAAIAWARICMIVKSDINTCDVFRSRSIEPSAARFEDDDVNLYGERDEMRREVWRVVAEREQHLHAFGCRCRARCLTGVTR